MTPPDPKTELHRYLQAGRDAMLWKLDGLSEYDVRRPMTPTGTNLLGLVKHLAGVEVGYFAEPFGRPFAEPLPWSGNESEPNVDMWATPDESRQQVVDLYARACTHADATIDALTLDAPGHIPHWPDDRREVTLHRILIHVIAETDRHAGHADIVRELIDGAAGLRRSVSNLAEEDADWWVRYRDRLEDAARRAGRDLVTARLVLHPMSASEAERVVDGHPDGSARWAPGYPADGEVIAARRLLAAHANTGDPQPFGNYEIRRREDGQAIGGVGFHGPMDENGSVAIGFGLIPSARGKGYASEALRGLLLFARERGVTCVKGDTVHDNVASQHVMLAAGMRPAGEDESVRYFEITWTDVTRMTGSHP